MSRDSGTARVIFASCARHEYVEIPYQEIFELNIPEECLKLADNRYLARGNKGRYTEVGGSKESVSWFFTNIPVLYRSGSDNCYPFGIFNILQVPMLERNKVRFMKRLNSSHCGLPELTVVAESFGIHLDKA
jgi:hypothetical protein